MTSPTQIANRLAVILQKPNPKKIAIFRFAVTYKCNSQCKHCNIWRKYKDNPEEANKELKIEEIKEMFEKSQYLRHLQGISLTGGEPFLREDFVDLCGFFIEKYPEAIIGIPTNALRPNLIADKLEEISDRYKPKNTIDIGISLDGIGKNHDEQRGVSGSYNRALKLIELLNANFPSIEKNMGFTITPQNYKDLLDVYNLSKELDIRFGFRFAESSGVFYGDNIEKRFGWDEFILSEVEEAIVRILEDQKKKNLSNLNLKSLLRQIDTIGIDYLSKYHALHATDFIRDPSKSEDFTCYSGAHSLFMDPYGNMFPCIMLDKKMGNIRESSFDEIWMSEKAKEIREFIAEKKCRCWAGCEVNPSLARDKKMMLWVLSRILRDYISCKIE
jgi:MoaA/NifB/PqqE/SkfB family radical SAM enzyme